MLHAGGDGPLDAVGRDPQDPGRLPRRRHGLGGPLALLGRGGGGPLCSEAGDGVRGGAPGEPGGAVDLPAEEPADGEGRGEEDQRDDGDRRDPSACGRFLRGLGLRRCGTDRLDRWRGLTHDASRLRMGRTSRRAAAGGLGFEGGRSVLDILSRCPLRFHAAHSSLPGPLGPRPLPTRAEATGSAPTLPFLPAEVPRRAPTRGPRSPHPLAEVPRSGLEA